MTKIRLDADTLRVESFTVRARGGLACLQGDAPEGEFYNTGNDHCTGPTYVVVTCGTCDDAYDTCAFTCGDTCLDSCADTCGFSCETCNMSNGKLICPE